MEQHHAIPTIVRPYGFEEKDYTKRIRWLVPWKMSCKMELTALFDVCPCVGLS